MDYLSGMISTLVEGGRMRRSFVTIQGIKINVKILDCLESKGYIRGFTCKGPNKIVVFLKYSGGKPVIFRMRMISKRSKRVYVKKEHTAGLLQGSVYILSTNEGIKSSSLGVSTIGGELLLKVN